MTVATKRGEPAVKPEEIKAVLDLSNKGTGIYNVPVQLVAPDVVVQSLSPASVTLTIERIEQRSFPVTRPLRGCATGRHRRRRARAIEPQTAVVRAADVAARAGFGGAGRRRAAESRRRRVDEMVRAVAVNASGAEISGLSVAPNLVRVADALRRRRPDATK